MNIVGSVSNPNRLIGSHSDPQPSDPPQRVGGMFSLPLPYSVGLEIDKTSYMTPQDSGSVPGLAVSEFLARFPMYDHVLFSYYLETSDLTDIAIAPGSTQPTAATVTPTPPPWAAYTPGSLPRTQLGSLGGVVPNAVAMLPVDPVNSTYGCVVTDKLDITSLNPSNPGTDEVMMWWALGKMAVSEDVVRGFGLTAGLNTPAVKTLERLDPETSGIYVYASNDNGASWYRVEYMEPTDLTTGGTDIRFAFINTTPDKVVLLGWAALIPDLP